eukprot:2309151-Prymnesium_polylepis.1
MLERGIGHHADASRGDRLDSIRIIECAGRPSTHLNLACCDPEVRGQELEKRGAEHLSLKPDSLEVGK